MLPITNRCPFWWALIKPIPFWEAFKSYTRQDHLAAIKKFGVLWIASISPLLLSAVSQPVPTGESRIINFVENIWTAFNGTNQFIYAVSFITPVIYLLWEQFHKLRSHILSKKRSLRDLNVLPPGYGWILVWSVVVFLFTAIAYAIATNQVAVENPSIIQSVAANSALFVYLFSLLCWYFTMLDGSGIPAETYAEILEQGEQKQKDALHERLKNRGSGDGS